MKYDFDEVIPRIGTNSSKWEYFPVANVRGATTAADPSLGDDQVLPMWVADMDFRCAEPIIQALRDRVEHGLFGYTVAGDSYYEAVIDWYQRRHGWTAERDWIISTNGVVPAINMLVRALIKPGEKVIIQTPVYHPFYNLGENNGAELVFNPLIEDGPRYVMDYEHLAKVAADPAATVLVLCNPHNPAGICWRDDELAKMAEICLANNVTIVSDEIHCDLIFPGKTFNSVASISDEVFRKSVICTAPSKTFSLAGLHMSSIIIPDAGIRDKMMGAMAGTGMYGINPFSLVALEAAYREGEDWLTQCMEYIAANYDYMADFFATHIPQIKPFQPDGTYLIWLDCRDLGMDHKALESFMQERVKITFNEGYTFGDAGKGFERINIACPRSILERALNRLKTELDKLEIQ